MRYATGGTVLGTELALEHGWAINLSGGYHHAKRDQGGGFCIFADIPLAVRKLQEKHPDYKIMIIDLDAHQGNGLEEILKDDPSVFIFDVYNAETYPMDEAAKKWIQFDFPIPAFTGSKTYLELLGRELPLAIDEVAPDFIFYNAGTDILIGDSLGALRVSAKGIIQRDKMVFDEAVKRKIPILMTLSGGYTSKSAEIVGKSITNIFKDLKNK